MWTALLAVNSDGLVARLALDTLQLIYHVNDRLGRLGRSGARPLGEVELCHYTTLLRLCVEEEEREEEREGERERGGGEAVLA